VVIQSSTEVAIPVGFPEKHVKKLCVLCKYVMSWYVMWFVGVMNIENIDLWSNWHTADSCLQNCKLVRPHGLGSALLNWWFCNCYIAHSGFGVIHEKKGFVSLLIRLVSSKQESFATNKNGDLLSWFPWISKIGRRHLHNTCLNISI
jgi:hypothetical protein